MLLIGRRLPRWAVHAICCLTVLSAGLVSLTLPEQQELVLATWLPGLGADWGFLVDRLSRLMILIVTGIGLLVHIYSIGYMEHEPGHYRYFGYLNLFVFFMLLLVLANNYALAFAGWEGVGLASYLLIGFHFDRKAAGDAANKAFLVNRAADAAFLLGMFTLLAGAGTLRYTELTTAGTELWISTAAALLFVAACGKSAQFPFQVWLPDAMEGPTPVSALIHAATMVTAGIYLIVRSQALFAQAPKVLAVMGVVGAVTAILAATTAMVQNDIKRVLAYSTVSQLGLMFIALGVGAWWTAVFHLFTHAFFKALLFLSAGAVIHSLDGEQDMRRMGGLRKNFPFAFWTMVIGALAISGVPGLAGFLSKDEILWRAFERSPALWGFGVVTSLLTAFYMWRLVYLTFCGPPHHAEPHALPWSMRAPLVVLAIGSVFAGYVPLGSGHGTDKLEYVLMAVASAAAVTGILLAHRQVRLLSPFYFLFGRGWYVDDLVTRGLARGFALSMARGLSAFDRGVVDGGVNGAGLLTRLVSRGSILGDTWVVDGAVRFTGLLVRVSSYPARLIQSGSLQNYALMALAGLAAFLGWALTRGAR